MRNFRRDAIAVIYPVVVTTSVIWALRVTISNTLEPTKGFSANEGSETGIVGVHREIWDDANDSS
jgi:hypothetical protein